MRKVVHDKARCLSPHTHVLYAMDPLPHGLTLNTLRDWP